MTPILCIHGAGASPVSFAFLFEKLQPTEILTFSYEVSEPVMDVAKRLRAHLSALGRKVVLLGHSLGGLIAALVADDPLVDRVITLCAPFGGIKSSVMMAMVSPAPLFRDTSPYGPVIAGLRFHGKPHLAFYATAGLPLPGGQPNDGVVAVSSQRALEGPFYVEVDLNHFEVLLSGYVAMRIGQFAA